MKNKVMEIINKILNIAYNINDFEDYGKNEQYKKVLISNLIYHLILEDRKTENNKKVIDFLSNKIRK